MVVHDGRFAILVSANLGISAYYILRKCLKELVAGYFGATVNNRLNKELLVSR